jgi:hypothetical protein
VFWANVRRQPLYADESQEPRIRGSIECVGVHYTPARQTGPTRAMFLIGHKAQTVPSPLTTDPVNHIVYGLPVPRSAGGNPASSVRSQKKADRATLSVPAEEALNARRVCHPTQRRTPGSPRVRHRKLVSQPFPIYPNLIQRCANQ